MTSGKPANFLLTVFFAEHKKWLAPQNQPSENTGGTLGTGKPKRPIQSNPMRCRQATGKSHAAAFDAKLTENSWPRDF